MWQLTDFFTLFYFNFMKDSHFDDEHFWTNFIESARHCVWSGYAFEQVCLAHLPQIKQKLGIIGVLTNTSSWRSRESMITTYGILHNEYWGEIQSEVTMDDLFR
jgi:hypothetical protein